MVHECREHTCEVCGKTYKDITSFNNHIKSHDKSNESTCELCGKVFPTPIAFKEHKKYVKSLIFNSLNTFFNLSFFFLYLEVSIKRRDHVQFVVKCFVARSMSRRIWFMPMVKSENTPVHIVRSGSYRNGVLIRNLFFTFI